MNEYIKDCLFRFIVKSKKYSRQVIDAMTEYLNDQFEILTDNLMEGLFKKVIKLLWDTLLQVK